MTDRFGTGQYSVRPEYSVSEPLSPSVRNSQELFTASSTSRPGSRPAQLGQLGSPRSLTFDATIGIDRKRNTSDPAASQVLSSSTLGFNATAGSLGGTTVVNRSLTLDDLPMELEADLEKEVRGSRFSGLATFRASSPIRNSGFDTRRTEIPDSSRVEMQPMPAPAARVMPVSRELGQGTVDTTKSSTFQWGPGQPFYLENKTVAFLSLSLILLGFCLAAASYTGAWSHVRKVDQGKSGLVSWYNVDESDFFLLRYHDLTNRNNLNWTWFDYDTLPSGDPRSGCHDPNYSTVIATAFGLLANLFCMLFLYMRGYKPTCGFCWRLTPHETGVKVFTYMSVIVTLVLYAGSACAWLFGCHDVLLNEAIASSSKTLVGQVYTTVSLGPGFWLQFGNVLVFFVIIALQAGCHDGYKAALQTVQYPDGSCCGLSTTSSTLGGCCR